MRNVIIINCTEKQTPPDNPGSPKELFEISLSCNGKPLTMSPPEQLTFLQKEIADGSHIVPCFSPTSSMHDSFKTPTIGAPANLPEVYPATSEMAHLYSEIVFPLKVLCVAGEFCATNAASRAVFKSGRQMFGRWGTELHFLNIFCKKNEKTPAAEFTWSKVEKNFFVSLAGVWALIKSEKILEHFVPILWTACGYTTPLYLKIPIMIASKYVAEYAAEHVVAKAEDVLDWFVQKAPTAFEAISEATDSFSAMTCEVMRRAAENDEKSILAWRKSIESLLHRAIDLLPSFRFQAQIMPQLSTIDGSKASSSTSPDGAAKKPPSIITLTKQFVEQQVSLARATGFDYADERGYWKHRPLRSEWTWLKNATEGFLANLDISIFFPRPKPLSEVKKKLLFVMNITNEFNRTFNDCKIALKVNKRLDIASFERCCMAFEKVCAPFLFAQFLFPPEPIGNPLMDFSAIIPREIPEYIVYPCFGKYAVYVSDVANYAKSLREILYNELKEKITIIPFQTPLEAFVVGKHYFEKGNAYLAAIICFNQCANDATFGIDLRARSFLYCAEAWMQINLATYNLSLLSIPETTALPNLSQIPPNEQPVLVKAGQKIYIYGKTISGDFGYTELDASKLNSIAFPPVGSDKPIKINSGNLTPAIYEEITVKKGHTYYADIKSNLLKAIIDCKISEPAVYVMLADIVMTTEYSVPDPATKIESFKTVIKALQAAPTKTPEILIRLAFLCGVIQDNIQAISNYEAYLATAPGSNDIQAMLACAELHLQQSNFDMAKARFEQVLNKDPQNSSAIGGLCAIYLREATFNATLQELGIQLKTQTFGVSSNYFHRSCCWHLPPTGLTAAQLVAHGIQNTDDWRKKKEFVFQYDGNYGGIVAINEAVHNYREKRENGAPCDNPISQFPEDGSYTLETGGNQSFQSLVRYTEGPGDHAWMAEKDQNYVTRLKQERRLKEMGSEDWLRNEEIKILELVNINLNAHLDLVERVLASKKSLTAINLTNTALNDAAIQRLLRASMNNRAITQFIIDGNAANTETKEWVSALLALNHDATTVDLDGFLKQHNIASLVGISHMLRLLPLRPVVNLHVNVATLTPDHIAVLDEWISVSESLQVLDLSSILPSSETFGSLLAAMKKNPRLMGVISSTASNTANLLLLEGARNNDLSKIQQAIYMYHSNPLQLPMELLRDQASVSNFWISTSCGWNVLHWAAYHGNTRMLEIIINELKNQKLPIEGAEGMINKQTAEPYRFMSTGKQTPAHIAITGGKNEAYSFLVRNGADLTIKDAEGKTPDDYVTAKIDKDSVPDKVEPVFTDAATSVASAEKPTAVSSETFPTPTMVSSMFSRTSVSSSFAAKPISATTETSPPPTTITMATVTTITPKNASQQVHRVYVNRFRASHNAERADFLSLQQQCPQAIYLLPDNYPDCTLAVDRLDSSSARGGLAACLRPNRLSSSSNMVIYDLSVIGIPTDSYEPTTHPLTEKDIEEAFIKIYKQIKLGRMIFIPYVDTSTGKERPAFGGGVFQMDPKIEAFLFKQIDDLEKFAQGKKSLVELNSAYQIAYQNADAARDLWPIGGQAFTTLPKSAITPGSKI